MSVIDRLLDSLVAAAAAPLFTPDRPRARIRPAPAWAGSAQVAATDAAAVVEAAEVGMSVVALSRIAAERAPRPAVRGLANGLLTQYGADNAELARLSADKRLTLPLAAGAPVRAHADELAAMTEDALEQAYLRRMDEEQERTRSLLRRLRDGDDAEFAAFAVSRLPTVERHLAETHHLTETHHLAETKKSRKTRKKGG